MANVNLIDSSNIKVTQSNNNISLDFGSETVVDSIRTKNMFDNSYINNQWVGSSGSIIDGATGANARKISCASGDTFTLSATFGSSDSNNIIVMAFYNASGTLLNRYVATNSTTLTLTETAPSNTSYMYVGHYFNLPNTIQLEEGNTATTYAPYQNLTGQIIASTSWGTVPSGFNGSLPYIKVGNVVFLSVMDYKTTSDITAHDTILGSNLPKAVTDIVFLSYRRDMSLSVRMRITTNGDLRLHYSSFPASSNEIYGMVIYTTSD